MESIFLKLLEKQISKDGKLELEVTGTSMLPTLNHGDRIIAVKSDSYCVGDVIVFTYKDQTLLVHRIVNKMDSCYFCKGDNSFRLEDISLEQILGKVIFKNANIGLPKWDNYKVRLSYNINRCFFQNRYDIEKTITSSLYKHYTNMISKDVSSISFLPSKKLNESVIFFEQMQQPKIPQQKMTMVYKYLQEHVETSFTLNDMVQTYAETSDVDVYDLIHSLIQNDYICVQD